MTYGLVLFQFSPFFHYDAKLGRGIEASLGDACMVLFCSVSLFHLKENMNGRDEANLDDAQFCLAPDFSFTLRTKTE